MNDQIARLRRARDEGGETAREDLRRYGIEHDVPDGVEWFLDTYDRAATIEQVQAARWKLLRLALERRTEMLFDHIARARSGEYPLREWVPGTGDIAREALEAERKLQSGEWPEWECEEDAEKSVAGMAQAWRENFEEERADGRGVIAAAASTVKLESVDRVVRWKTEWRKSNDPELVELGSDKKGWLG